MRPGEKGGRGERCGGFATPRILHAALYEKYKAAGHDVFLKYTMGFFLKLPTVALGDGDEFSSEEKFILAYPGTKKSIVDSAVRHWPIREAPTNESRILFRFLVVAYTGQKMAPGRSRQEFYGHQAANEEMRKYIEGLIRTELSKRQEKPEDLLRWTQEPNLPEKLHEIFLIAFLKNSDLSKAETALRSLIATT